MIEILETLGYDAESRRNVKRSNPGFATRRLKNSFCQPSSKQDTSFESGKHKAVKREGWAPPFICCAQGAVGL